ncbi:capsule assembly Wzi family protein [bacterium]|nr:capsule assembly Wzi family protein [bacterium]
MRLKIIIPVLIMAVFLSVSGWGDATTYVPVSHRVYDFLERMELHYFFSGAFLGTKPFTRGEIAALLTRISDKSTVLSPADKSEYECLMAEFRPDIPSRKGMVWDDYGPVRHMPGFLKGFVYRNRRNMFSASGDNYSLYVDPVIVRNAEIRTSKSFTKDDRVYTDSNGFALRGTVGDHVGFYIDTRDSKEWGNREYNDTKVTTMPGRGYVSFKGDRAEFDETNAHLTYSSGPFLLSLGRGRTRWGRGTTGTLGLSDYASPYDMFRFDTGFWRLKFTFFAAELEQYPPVARWYYNNPPGAGTDSVTVKKHMSGHRVELNVTRRLSIGLYETVIYGGRWDLAYLSPVMFLKSAEHSSGDHDNSVMGMDFRLLVHRAHSIYGEFMFDDISMGKLGTDWYGNKFACQIGSFLVEPFGFRDADIRIEYSRIDPWVYSHKFPINGYNHYGDVLGYYSGPNTDVLFFQVRKRFSRRFHTILTLEKSRHGANPPGTNIGGDALRGHRDTDPTKAHFLDGDLEKVYAGGVDFSYEFLWQLVLRLGYTYEDCDGKKINVYRFSLGLNQ